MRKKSIEIRNQSKEIDKSKLASEIVENVVGQRKGSRSEKYHLYRLFGLSTESAANLSGLTIKSGYDLNHRLKHNDRAYQNLQTLLSGFPGRYRDLCRARLLELSEIEGKALDEYRKDPKLLIDKPQLAKQVKQAAGVNLGEQVGPVVQNIHIDSVQAIMTSLQTSREGDGDLPPPAMRALEAGEVIEVEEGEDESMTEPHVSKS